MTSKHDADQAGGAKAEFFESDGATAEPVQFPSFTNAPDLDDAPPMTAEAAFEVFAGKLFSVNPYKEKVRSPTSSDNETPLQRLARIKTELEDLQGESMLQEDIGKLQAQMQQLSLVQSQRQDHLTATIQASMAVMDVPESTATSAISKTQNPLEARVLQLETTSRWLHDHVPAVEDVEVLQKRAKVIRQDLEAAAKARNKLAAVSSGEDSKAIAALYDQLQQLQGISRYLPALTERLQALAHQHVNVGSQQARFQAVESAANQLQQQVESIEGSVARLETLMETNAQTMKASIDELQKSLQKM